MPDKNGGLYEFGDFRLDARRKILYRAGAPVALKPKAIETLIVLVENAGEVVGKAELMNTVWRDSFVEENNLSVNIYALRKAFALYDEQIYIQTVPRRGFRFAVPVKEIAVTNGNGAVKIEQELIESETETQSVERETKSPNETIAPTIPAQMPRAKTLNFNMRRAALAAIVLLGMLAVVGGSLYALRREQAAGGKTKNDLPPQNLVAGRGTQSEEARGLYLRGYELWQTRDNAQMSEGVELFKKAIEIDPQFAAPYSGVADSLAMLDNNQAQWREAEDYAAKAVALAPDSADAYATLGFIAAMNKWHWTEAENYFRRALELDESSGKAHQWYATVLMIERRFPEAEAHLKRAIEIYPLSPNYNADLTELYFYTRRDADLQAHCLGMEKTGVKARYSHCHNEYTLALREKRFDDAVRIEYEGRLKNGRSIEQIENSDWFKAYKAKGGRGWITNEIERLEKIPDDYNATFDLAFKYAQIGDRGRALGKLEKAFDERMFLLPFANVRTEFDDLRADPRFQNLMRRIGLPESEN